MAAFTKNFQLGMNGKLYWSATALTATATTTGWTTTMNNVTDVSVTMTGTKADITTRDNNGFKGQVVTFKEATIKFKMVWKPSDSALTAIVAAWKSGDEVALAAMTGPIADANHCGLAGNFTIDIDNFNQPLGEAIMLDVTATGATHVDFITVTGG